MRMWCIQTHLMCKRHIVQEHADMHRFERAVKEGKDMSMYTETGHLEQDYIVKRHDELVKELGRRDISHKTPLKLSEQPYVGIVRSRRNQMELRKKCDACHVMQDRAILSSKKSM
jgi:hypothetical protein